MADHLDMRSLLNEISSVSTPKNKRTLKEGKKGPSALMENAGYRTKETGAYTRKDFFIPDRAGENASSATAHKEVVAECRKETIGALKKTLGKGKLSLAESTREGGGRRLRYIYEGERGKAAVGYDLILHADNGDQLMEVSQGVVFDEE